MSEIHIKRNHGAALMLFVMITITIASALLLKALNLGNPVSAQNSDRNTLILAKEALMGYALSYADKNANNLPGYLPCPDTDGDGLENAPCGSVNQSAIGRIPWQTLGLQALRDSSGECLWYAVSGAYKENPAGALSTDANGQFLLFDVNLNSLNGVNNAETAIALIFSPGKPLANQNRSVTLANLTECASTRAADGVNRARNYMETLSGINNATGKYTSSTLIGLPVAAIPTTNYSSFIDSGPVPSQPPRDFNDTVVKITATDFQTTYSYMQKWIGERVRQCLNTYAANNAGKLPWPAVLAPPGNPGFSDNATQQRFGRIANNLSNTQANGLNPLWPIDPQQPGTRCFNWSWWPAVRESVFYAIDSSITPIGLSAALTLTVDATPAKASILIAGREVNNQRRLTGIDKGTISNYLESENVIDSATGRLPPGDENFISSDNAAAFFNDYVCTLNSCP